MAWTYSDWFRKDLYTTAVAQRNRLALHLQEMTDKISADVSAHGYGRQSHPLVETFKVLLAKYDALCASTGGTSGGVSFASFVQPS